MLRCVWFWASLKGWIETFYKKISSCVINNEMCNSQFEIQRGVRRGDPMSPYLFIIVAEVLATAIRTTNIQGIKIRKEEFKRQSALDSTGQFGPVVRFPSNFQQQTKLI